MTEETLNVAGERLKSFIDRIERLNEEKAGLHEDIKEVYSELKSVGFDAKAVRKLVALRKKTQEAIKEEAAILETYAAAINMEVS